MTLTGAWAVDFLARHGSQLSWDPGRTQAVIDAIQELPDFEAETPSASFWRYAAQIVAASGQPKANETAGVFLGLATTAPEGTPEAEETSRSLLSQFLATATAWSPTGAVAAAGAAYVGGVSKVGETVANVADSVGETVSSVAGNVVDVVDDTARAIEKGSSAVRTLGFLGILVAAPFAFKAFFPGGR